MPRKIVLVSGSVASGKTTLVERLHQEFDDVHILKTKEVIRELALKKLGHKLESERRAMQLFGDRLDRETKGQWVRDALRRILARLGPSEAQAVIIVDAVRIPEQIKKIRESYGYSVVHIHLRAPTEVLAERYKLRKSGLRELVSFSAVAKNTTEARVEGLERIADIVVDTELSLAEDVLVRAASYLGLYSREYDRTVDIVVGGQFGSEGKGHIASYLAREYQVLVRVGGPNAGHKVYFDDAPYTHHQLPSGTLRNPLAKLVIAPGAVLNADLLMKEIADCKVDAERLAIDPQTMIISRKDIMGEKGLTQRISSTGQGVGFATGRRIVDRGKKGVKLARDVKELAPFTRRAAWEVLEQAYSRGDRVLVEGTQGAGLSLYHGEYPFVTSRDTTVGGCLSEAGISPSRVRKIVMVCRTHPIRVQNPEGSTSGRLSQEISWETVSRRSGIKLGQLVKSERTSTTNRSRRVGEFDWRLLRKASAISGPTDIALTFADYLDQRNENARRYEQLRPETIRFIEEVERVAAAPVSLISTRFDFRSVIDRRYW
jgi:adenylosuccinate synthase